MHLWGSVRIQDQHRSSDLRPTIDFVEVRCAGCGCIVEAGIRVSVCGDPNCCCRELRTRGPDPTAEDASDSES